MIWGLTTNLDPIAPAQTRRGYSSPKKTKKQNKTNHIGVSPGGCTHVALCNSYLIIIFGNFWARVYCLDGGGFRQQTIQLIMLYGSNWQTFPS